MKQIIQNLKSGETILEDVPAPIVKEGTVLIKTRKSLVSLGTEKMLVEFGKANLVQKARQQPDKVKMVLDKIRTDGLQPTLETVFSKLNQPLPLGYCNVGVVQEVGNDVNDIRVGDRVISNGHHAEYVCVPKNLVAKVPDNVSDEDAAFTVIGSIGLQGIRLISPTFGETIVVIGLGLIGLLTAQLLKANGCRVIGTDFDEKKIQLARKLGIEAIQVSSIDPVKFVMEATQTGADGVIITASSPSNDIISQAAQMSRKRGRIILVGVIGLNISRADFYEKELTFQVSCSYGPGRYDDDYEQKGIDYPLPFVRWTERRNFQAILEAISTRQLRVSDLITEQVELENYHKIYGQIGKSDSIASIINYPEQEEYSTQVTVHRTSLKPTNGRIGVIGAGNFTNTMILPVLNKVGADVKYIVSAGGLNAKSLANKFKIPLASSRYQDALEDSEVDLALITTRHDLHASMILKSLKAGKHVFVEKPLALKLDEINAIDSSVHESERSVTVGFNRRFSPHALKVKSLIGEGAILNMNCTMNAGFIPVDSWVHDPAVGGGRILGEACHYIDLMVFLSGSTVKSVCMSALGTSPKENTDNASILLKFENGSNGVLNYFSNGSKSYSKERVEVFAQGKVLIIDNFRKTTGYGVKGFRSFKSSLDKGHFNQFSRLNASLKEGGQPIIPWHEILNVSRTSILALESLKSGKWIDVD